MIRRGSIVLVALSGDFGKPRPAVVVQADLGDDLVSRIICPLTTTVIEHRDRFRPIVEPTAGNGLRLRSQIMADKPHVIAIEKLGEPIGQLSPETMAEVSEALTLLLGLV